MGWWRRRGLRRSLQRLLKNTTNGRTGARFAHDEPCSCPTPWSHIESTANGFPMAAVKSEHYSVMTNPDLGPLVARCTVCHAHYPYPWVVDTTTGPMPFGFDQRSQ
ncbi:hypothetical protein Pa4123_81970 [Phytohabitans aurantiacus]|uniref:Uncharacterized protein n=1 Tax=Phytohabitans aurantiacus TaxID=3016789 RepID=A0ABQ5R825_9ACTN|nr:hypothetical protein Pa4123_81970 [Phytohabitans aurantiacus]